MYYFEDIIKEIEAQIGGEIDIEKLSKMANMSVYEFRRIFSFVTKISLGEYVRNVVFPLPHRNFFQEKSV